MKMAVKRKTRNKKQASYWNSKRWCVRCKRRTNWSFNSDVGHSACNNCGLRYKYRKKK